MRPPFELLVENVADYAIFLLDPTGIVSSWNPGAERIKQYRADEIIGRHFSTFYTQVDRDRNHPAHELAIARREGRYEEEGWRVRKDGTTFWAHVVITTLFGEGGEVLGFGKITRDLTTRRAAEQQLLQFQRMVSGVRDYAIFMLDATGTIVTWNAGAEHIKGYRADEIVGKHFSVFYTQDDRDRDHPTYELAVASRDGRYEEEGWRLRKDGTTFWANVVITAIHDEEGVLTGFAKVTRDLTERRRQEQDLRDARDELERFAVVAAHDLREPLVTISSYARLALETGSDPREALDRILDATQGMRHLIDDLLLYARLGRSAVELEPVALAPVVAKAIDRLGAAAAARGATFRVDVPPDARVCVDRMGADVLLQNLISNAIKFGAADGPRIDVGASREDDGWRLTVRDDGRGIAPEDQERIFEAFERVRGPEARPGQGLGLSICQRVVARSDGRIGVASPPGAGATFWVWLPAA